MQNKAKVNMVKMDKIEPVLSLCPRYEPVLSVAEGVEWVNIGKISSLGKM
jgi:hypothetical protein